MAFLGNAVSASIGWLRRLGGGAASTLLQGLVSYWPLDEISGTRYDVVGENHLTDNNTVGAVLRGPEGTVAAIDGVADEHFTGTLPGFSGTAFSVGGWRYPEPDGGNSNALSLNGGYWTVRIGIRQSDGYGNPFVYYYDGTAWNQSLMAGAGYYNKGWVHWFVTYDQATTTMKMYIDGVLRATNSTAAWFPHPAAPEQIRMEQYSGGVVRQADWGYWNRVLSLAEIQEMFNGGNGAKYADLSAGVLSGLVSWWAQDEVSGVRYDSHGSNDLTDNNTVGSVSSGPKGVVADIVAANNEYLTKSSFSIPTGDFEFNLWVKPDTDIGAGGNGDLLVVADSWPNSVSAALYVSGGNWYILIANGSTYFYALVPVVFDRGIWSNIALWYDSANSVLKVQINGGTVYSTTTLSGSLFGAGSSTTLRLGQPFAASVNWDGLLGPVAYWERALTAGERTSLFSSGRGKRYADLTADEKVGLVSYWNLDEKDGVRYDSHGTNHLTDNNTVGSVINAGDAMDGAAASFVAANSEYLTGDSPFSDVNSFSLWFKTSQSADYPTVFWHNPGDSNPPLGVYFTSSNTLVGRCTTSDNVQNEVTIATGANDGNWHHLMGWFDPDDNKGHFSLDSATPVATAAHAVATLRTSGVTVLSIGYFLYALFQGQVDELAVWSRVLTADERAELFALGRGKYYDFAS